MQKIKLYFQDTMSELLHKVSWPTWNELQSSTIVVMVASLIIAIIVFSMDTVFQIIMKFFYNMLA